MKPLNSCLEIYGIGERPACAKGVEGDCRLKDIFTACSIFHDRLKGQCDELPWDHHYMLKTHPPNFQREEYLQKGIEELTKKLNS